MNFVATALGGWVTADSHSASIVETMLSLNIFTDFALSSCIFRCPAPN